jgi:NitT/TauT family transport system substrate-binding protein
VPALGYVFRESWAAAHREALAGFLDAADAAKRRICESEAAWNSVAALIDEPDARVGSALRTRYCAGRVQHWGEPEKTAAGAVYALIQNLGGAGSGGALPSGLFWTR